MKKASLSVVLLSAIVCLGLIILSGCVGSDRGPSVVSNPIGQGSGSIQGVAQWPEGAGRVAATRNSSFLDRLPMRFASANTPMVNAKVMCDATGIETTTGADGSFALENVPDGTCFLVISKTASNGTIYKSAQQVPITGGNSQNLGTVNAKQVGAISGAVELSDGESPLGTNAFVPGTSMASFANADGEFFISSVPEGTYSVSFLYAGYQTVTVASVEVAAGHVTQLDGTVTLQKKAQETELGMIWGTVTDSQTHAGIEGALVSVGSYSTLTDSTGAFRLYAPHGEYKLRVQDEAYVFTYRDLSFLTGADAQVSIALVPLQAQVVGSIKGYVLDADDYPVPRATVSLSPGGSVLTDSEGLYKFDNLKGGSYRLKVSKTGFNPFTRDLGISSGQNLEVGDIILVRTVTDNAPYVRIVNLMDGDTVTGEITVLYQVYDDHGMREVSLAVDGGAAFASVNDACPGGMACMGSMHWDTTGLSAEDHTLTLTGTDNAGLTGTDSIDVTVESIIPANVLPVVTAAANPTLGTAPLVVQFTGTCADSDGTCSTYAWDFGDLGTSAVLRPSHTFTNPGTYTVSFLATDNSGGISMDSIAVTVLSAQEVENQPPTVNISATPTLGVAPFEVQFTGTCEDADGTCATYAWDFGDLSSSSVLSPSHTFTNPGSYTVSFIATDNDGAYSAASITIVVLATPSEGNLAPDVTLSASPVRGTVPVNVTFTITCSDPDGICDVIYINLGNGTSAVYRWDTTSNQKNINYTYTGNGVFNVNVTVYDNAGASDDASVVMEDMNAAPVLTASVDTASTVNPPLAANFSTVCSDIDGTCDSYAWTFGDGATSTEPNPTHSYGIGTFTATVTVTDDDGATDTDTVNINVVNSPPAVTASAAPVTGNPPLNVQFSADCSDPGGGTCVSYSWTFGDGATSTEQNPAHTYATYNLSGQYTASVTVTDDDGATDTDSVNVHVNRPPIASSSNQTGISWQNTTFTLNNDSSDPDGDALTYTWVQTAGPAVIIPDSHAAQPTISFTAFNGEYKFQLTVSDGFFTSQLNNITVSQLPIQPQSVLGYYCNGDYCGTSYSSANDLIVDGNKAYITYSTSRPGTHNFVDFYKLNEIDFSNPSGLVIARTWSRSTSDDFIITSAASVWGNYVYLADIGGELYYTGTQGVGNLTVIDKNSGSSVGSISISSASRGDPVDVTVSNGYAYVALGATGLKIFNVSNPSSPALNGTLAQSMNRVQVNGNYVYALGNNALSVIDVSNPASPSNATTISLLAAPYSLFISGNYLYVGLDNASGMRIYDISNPTAPTLAASVCDAVLCSSGDATINGIFVAGGKAYIADGANGLAVYDVSNPLAPVHLKDFDVGNAQGVYVSGAYAYVVTTDEYFVILDLWSLNP